MDCAASCALVFQCSPLDFMRLTVREMLSWYDVAESLAKEMARKK